MSARPIGPGSVVRVVAPSGPFDRDGFAAGLAFLEQRYEVRHRPDILDREGFLAGSDERRLAELLEALADPDADCILAARGGYGATRLLPKLPLRTIRDAAIPLVGFSDITALHARWASAGVPSLHGAMVAALGRASADARAHWLQGLEGDGDRFSGLETWEGGRVEGPLIGGNLAVLGALVGTPFAPPLDGALLLLEEIGERPYRMDRVLTSLQQAGWLDRIAGVVVGDLVDCRAGADGTEPETVLRERLTTLGVPVVAGLPLGHGAQNAALWLGLPYRLDASAGRLELVSKPSRTGSVRE